MTRLVLRAGASNATLAPDAGGGIAGLVLAGREILRRETSFDVAKPDPLSLGEFPMAPWVNRVANGRFVWQGREICVADGPGHDPQGLHGVCWRMPWAVLAREEHAAVLGMAWTGGEGWPFHFSLTRRFSLSPEQLSIEATLTNLGSEPMPAALGFHPYFPSRGATVTALAEAGWITDPTGLPDRIGLRDASLAMQSGLAIEDFVLDNCFIGWDGRATIDWPTHGLDVRTEPPLRYLQIYSPRATGYFCLEPQSAMPDAFNRAPDAGGADILQGGAQRVQTLALSITVKAIQPG